jgi:FtsZ-binding cell division protein ZapB
MLVGFIIAGPNPTGVACQNLRSQDSHPAQTADKKPSTTSARLQQSTSSKALEPAHGEIFLPEIHIAAAADTVATLKMLLEQAERDLRQLQRERNDLQNTLEQIQKRSLKGASPPAQRTTELLGRPSV